MKNLIAALLLGVLSFRTTAEERTINLRLTPSVSYKFENERSRGSSILVPIGIVTTIAPGFLYSGLGDKGAGGLVMAGGALMFTGSIINLARWTGENRNGRARCKAVPIGCALVGLGTIIVGKGIYDNNDGFLAYVALSSLFYTPGFTLITIGALVNLIRNTSFNDHYSLQFISNKPNEAGVALNF